MASLSDQSGSIGSEQTRPSGAIPVESLPPQALEQLIASLQQEVEQLADALQQLNFANQRWTLCKQSIEAFAEETTRVDLPGAQSRATDAISSTASAKPETPVEVNQNQRLLVPLSRSLYVLGRVINPERCLIDIGTGYHVERKLADAAEFFDRRLKHVRGSMQQLTLKIDQNQQQMQTIREILVRKLAGAQQAAEHT
jgi:prefoldin alpha subunit